MAPLKLYIIKVIRAADRQERQYPYVTQARSQKDALRILGGRLGTQILDFDITEI